MKIEGPSTTVNKSSEELFGFLTDIKNFEKLMPENTSKFEVLDDTTFVFALKGMPEIVLRLKDNQPHTKVVLGAASDKLPFTLTGNIQERNADTCEAQLVFEGDFNPMMAMMIKGPITNFVEALSKNMGSL